MEHISGIFTSTKWAAKSKTIPSCSLCIGISREFLESPKGLTRTVHLLSNDSAPAPLIRKSRTT